MKDAKTYEEVKIGKGSFWQEAVPKPYYGMNIFFKDTFKCHCGKKFKDESKYENHYRKEHIGES